MSERSAPIPNGAALGLLVWATEALALAIGAAGIGGASVLAALRDDLCWWGFAYALVGAVFGLMGRFAPLGWLALLLVADPGVVPWPLHAGLVALAAGVWAAFLRLGDRPRATLPAAAVSALAVGWLWPTSGPTPSGTAADRPDVVLIVVDTLRGDHATGPTFERLATEGVRFTRARSTSSWTLPAHASLFTGLLPSEHGAHAGHPRLDAGPETLAEALDARGYRTVGLSANAWVSGGTGLDRGFEAFAFLGDDGLVSQLLLALVARRPRDLGADALTRRAIEAVAEAEEAGEPLFLFVNYLEAHEPLGTLPGWDPTPGRRWMRDMPRFWCTCDSDAGELSCRDGLYRAPEDRIAATVAAYDAGVAYVDDHLGQLVSHLKRPTILVVTSDHGEHLGEDGRLGHMVWLDDALLDIPLVIRGPGLPAGAVDTAPFDLAELDPWLLARVDGRPPPPRRLAATSEVHPHPAATANRWGTLFGCDFSPATVARRVVVTPTGTVAAEGDDVPFEAGVGAALDPSTRRALEAIGYVDGPAGTRVVEALDVPAPPGQLSLDIGPVATSGIELGQTLVVTTSTGTVRVEVVDLRGDVVTVYVDEADGLELLQNHGNLVLRGE